MENHLGLARAQGLPSLGRYFPKNLMGYLTTYTYNPSSALGGTSIILQFSTNYQRNETLLQTNYKN